MEVKMKLNDVLNLNYTLKSIIDDNDTKVDALFKFKLLGIMREIEGHVNNFETIRNEKIAEYGKKDDNGNISISPDDEAAVNKFREDIKNITDSLVSVNISKLNAKEVFGKGVKAEYLIGLYQIIEE